MDSGALKKRLIRWMEDNRGLILTVVGLPASFIFDVVFQARTEFNQRSGGGGVRFLKG